MSSLSIDNGLSYIKMVAGYGVYEIMMIPIVCKCIYGKDKIVAYRLSQKIKVCCSDMKFMLRRANRLPFEGYQSSRAP